MKKTRSMIWILLLAFTCSGCAIPLYSIDRSGSKYANGYVVKRNDVIVPEFTTDEEGQAPQDKQIALKRFNRRKKEILRFYRQMGYFGTTVIEHAKVLPLFILAPFRAIFAGREQLRYERDPVYRAKVNTKEEIEQEQSLNRIKQVEEQMNEFIRQDMQKEADNN